MVSSPVQTRDSASEGSGAPMLVPVGTSVDADGSGVGAPGPDVK